MQFPSAFHKQDNEAAAPARTVPLRSEVPAADTWDLTALYPDPAAWQVDFERVRAEYPRLTDFKGTLGGSAEALARALEFDKTLNLRIERLYHYAALQASEDGSDAAYLARQSQLQNLLTRIEEARRLFHAGNPGDRRRSLRANAG